MLKQVLNLVHGAEGATISAVRHCDHSSYRGHHPEVHNPGPTICGGIQGEGPQAWPPHLYVFGVILSWASETSESAKDTYTKYKGLSLESRNDIIRLCKCSKMFNAETRKLTLMFGCGAEALALRSILLPLIIALPEASLRIGKAPRGYMEGELEEWLVSMPEQ